jgi:uncharacterized protein (DUF3084 family)
MAHVRARLGAYSGTEVWLRKDAVLRLLDAADEADRLRAEYGSASANLDHAASEIGRLRSECDRLRAERDEARESDRESIAMYHRCRDDRDRLRARLARCEAALGPFAAFYAVLTSKYGKSLSAEYPVCQFANYSDICVADDFKAARAALAEPDAEPGR